MGPEIALDAMGPELPPDDDAVRLDTSLDGIGGNGSEIEPEPVDVARPEVADVDVNGSEIRPDELDALGVVGTPDDPDEVDALGVGALDDPGEVDALGVGALDDPDEVEALGVGTPDDDAGPEVSVAGSASADGSLHSDRRGVLVDVSSGTSSPGMPVSKSSSPRGGLRRRLGGG